MPIPSRRRQRVDDRGAAMVEFAFVGAIFVLLLTGVISFGLILSFKQNLTQAAAEGARAGATALSDPVAEATTATNNAVTTFDKTCGAAGMACDFVLEDCGQDPEDGTIVNTPAVADCISVILVYDYDGFPILPEFPILSNMYPNTLKSGSTAEVNP